MTLRDDILANAACDAARAAKDCQRIADIMSVGRTQRNMIEIGNGTILGKIGIIAGSVLLDELNANTIYRYVKPLLTQGRLLIGDPLVQGTLQSMVPTFISQIDADKLCALGKDPYPYTMQEIGSALFTPEGNPI